MTFRHEESDEEDMGVSDEPRDGSTAGATKPLSLKSQISMSRESTKSHGASAQRKNVKRALKHKGLTEETALPPEEHKPFLSQTPSPKPQTISIRAWAQLSG